MTEEIDGVLKDAYIEPIPGNPDAKLWAWGDLYGDRKGRFEDGERVHTSYIVSGPDENGIIRTRNSVYRLEMRASDAQIPIPVLTPSQAKELGTRPVSEGVKASELDALEAMASRATPGPWDTTLGSVCNWHDGTFEMEVQVFVRDDAFGRQKDANVAYIAAANPQTVLRLLSMARQSLGGGSGLAPFEITKDLVNYIARYGGMCRDCADEAGICPHNGLPCEGDDKAIRHVLTALNYGVKHNFVALAPAVTSPPKGEEEPVAWTGSGSLSAIKTGREGYIWRKTAKSHPIPLFDRPNPVSAELVDLIEAAEAAVEKLGLYGFPVSSAAEDALLQQGSHQARELHYAATRLRAALSAHAGGTV